MKHTRGRHEDPPWYGVERAYLSFTGPHKKRVDILYEHTTNRTEPLESS